MLCTHCGAQMDAQSHFCPNCGQKVTENPADKSKESPPLKKMPLWFKAIIALTALGIVVGSAIALLQEDATDVVKQQLQALKEDHLTEAYYNYTSKSFREATSLEQFRDFVKGHSAFIKNSSVEFIGRDIQDNEGLLKATLSSINGITTNIDFQMVHEGDKWKILSIRIEDVNPAHTPTASDQHKQEENTQEPAEAADSPLLTPVKEQLYALKQGDMSGSYQTVISGKFAEITPKEKFEEYVKAHPILSSYTSVKYSHLKQHGHNGSVNALLVSPQGNVTVEYKLVKEGRAWKIWSLHLSGHPSSEPLSDAETLEKQIEGFNAAPLFETIQNQLQKIREHDLTQAYQSYTSEEFKNSTPQNTFETFIKGQPGLNSNTGIQFKNLTFDNNIANISGILETQEGISYPVVYSLVLDNEAWKIVHIQIQPPAKSEAAPSAEISRNGDAIQFSKFVLGTETDAQGVVLDPGKPFKDNSGDLYLNLYITNGSPGIKIEVLFTHVDSKSSIPPVSTTLSESGENILSFVFSPPKQGWPKGIYRIQATSSTGENASFNFKVN